MATDGVSNDTGGPSGVSDSRDAGGVDAADRADVAGAADVADAGDVDAEADAIAGAEDDGFEAAAPSGVDNAEVAAQEADEAAATREAEEAAAAEAAALEAARAANPAGPLADPNITREALDAHLQGLSTPDLTGVVKGVDQPEMGYGDAVTPQGWDALSAEIDRRFDEARENQDWANQDLADLSVEVVRQREFGPHGPSYSERQYRQVASGMTGVSRDPAAQAVNQTLDRATRLEQAHIMGDVPVTEMTNRQLIESVRDIPGMRAFGDIASLSGAGMILGFAAEARADERTRELEARLADGRITNVSPDLGAPNTTSRVVGTLVLAGEIAGAVSPRGWLRDGFRAIFRHGDDAARALNRAFNGVPVGDLRAPLASRHSIDAITARSWAKGTTTVAESGVDMAGDVAAIRRGEGVISGDRITINGRTYGAHDGTLYPIEGAGLHQLDRGAFKAIQEIRRAGSLEGAQRALDGMGIPQATRDLAARLLGLN